MEGCDVTVGDIVGFGVVGFMLGLVVGPSVGLTVMDRVSIGKRVVG